MPLAGICSPSPSCRRTKRFKRWFSAVFPCRF